MADEEAAIGVRRPLLAPHNGDDEARHAADAGDDATPARTSTADNYAPGAALPAEGSEADEISGNTACASSSGCSLLSVTATLTIGAPPSREIRCTHRESIFRIHAFRTTTIRAILHYTALHAPDGTTEFAYMMHHIVLCHVVRFSAVF